MNVFKILTKVFLAPTESMLSCWIPGQCWSDSASSSQCSRVVCYMLYCLITGQNVDLTASSSPLPQRVCYKSWTMLIWVCLVITTPTVCMSYCSILGQCDLTLLLPQKVCYPDLISDNVELTLPRHYRSHRKYAILFWSLDNVDLTLPCHQHPHSSYVISLWIRARKNLKTKDQPLTSSSNW